MIFTKLNHDLASRIKFVPEPEEIHLLNKAIDAATQSVQRFRVGAACSQGSAFNTTDLHAETHMLLARVGEWTPGRDATVAVARLGRKWDWRCSYPCASCANQLRSKGFRKVVCFDEGGQPVTLAL